MPSSQPIDAKSSSTKTEVEPSVGCDEGSADRLNVAPLCDHNWVDSNGDTLRFCTRCGLDSTEGTVDGLNEAPRCPRWMP